MNKRKFYTLLNIILSAATALYGFEALANKYTSKLYQEKDLNHFYIQGGYGNLDFNIFELIIERIKKANLSLSTGYYYELESNSRLRGELEINFTTALLKILNDKEYSFSPTLFINGYYDMSIPNIKGLYVNFGAGIGVSKNIEKSLENKDQLIGVLVGKIRALKFFNQEIPQSVKNILPQKVTAALQDVRDIPDQYIIKIKEEKNIHEKFNNIELKTSDLGRLKLTFGIDYHLTDHFSISNQLYLSSIVAYQEGLTVAFKPSQVSTGVFTWFKYSF